MICDCGGGTVDIISYTIRQVSPYPTFAKVCEGIGKYQVAADSLGIMLSLLFRCKVWINLYRPRTGQIASKTIRLRLEVSQSQPKR